MAQAATIDTKPDPKLERLHRQAEAEEFKGSVEDLNGLRAKLQENIDSARVSPLDADFLTVFPIAIALDLLAITAAILYFIPVLPISSTVISIFVGIFLTFWMWWRTGQLENAVARAHETLAQAAEGGGTAKSTLRKVRYAYMARKQLGKLLVRFGLGVVSNLLPLLGLIPFWTIFVILTAKERRNLADEIPVKA